MKKYIENIEKNKLGYSIVLVAAWFAILRIADTLVYFLIDYVAFFLVILFYGLIMYLICKNDKFSKLLKSALCTIYSLCFLMSGYVLLTLADIFLFNLVYLCYSIIFAISGLIYGMYLVLNRRKLEKIIVRYSNLGYWFFFVTYFFVLNILRFV